ncbi:hypothetical protein H5410_033184 [Solanum commersonii]|uniref:Uncharacterized protein n=1 Tax=Solanum commersonii TaxID=4109 RepID=A0A9J5YSC2_SOLCO|nr:hypothetical protein H5410_033184 [Solanum commersonii]
MNTKKLEFGNSHFWKEIKNLEILAKYGKKVRARAWERREKEEKKGKIKQGIVVFSSGVIPTKVCES